MYRTCLFCHADLGQNEAIERFTVGKRLAFDSDRGRLWVICPRCRQWNLTPVEERWEAIEDCERRFRATRLRVSTDQIGLARLAAGLELVRIGNPERPEFAAWRYGEQLGRRRRITMIKVGIGLGALGAVVAGGAAAGIGIGGVGYGIYQIAEQIVKGSPNKLIARVPLPEGEPLKVRRKHLAHVNLLPTGEGGWTLGVPNRKRMFEFEGKDAVRVAGQLLPQLNRFGGTKERVSSAVELLEQENDPLRYFERAAKMVRHAKAPKIALLPESARLALEMAAHEETERRALEGELGILEAAWREAEEIAAIADNLFLPASVEEFIRRHRPGGDGVTRSV